jgi:hypothetical protein
MQNNFANTNVFLVINYKEKHKKVFVRLSARKCNQKQLQCLIIDS